MKQLVLVAVFMLSTISLTRHERLREIWNEYDAFIDFAYANQTPVSACDEAEWSINPLITSWHARTCR